MQVEYDVLPSGRVDRAHESIASTTGCSSCARGCGARTGIGKAAGMGEDGRGRGGDGIDGLAGRRHALPKRARCIAAVRCRRTLRYSLRLPCGDVQRLRWAVAPAIAPVGLVEAKPGRSLRSERVALGSLLRRGPFVTATAVSCTLRRDRRMLLLLFRLLLLLLLLLLAGLAEEGILAALAGGGALSHGCCGLRHAHSTNNCSRFSSSSLAFRSF